MLTTDSQRCRRRNRVVAESATTMSANDLEFTRDQGLGATRREYPAVGRARKGKEKFGEEAVDRR